MKYTCLGVFTLGVVSIVQIFGQQILTTENPGYPLEQVPSFCGCNQEEIGMFMSTFK